MAEEEASTSAPTANSEVAKALGELRGKADSLPPAMRKDFDEIIGEVERHLHQPTHNVPVLRLLMGGIADLFGSHVPEITTLLSMIGR